jgi:hypothetical protein
MGPSGVLRVRRRPGDDRGQTDERGTGIRASGLDGGVEGFDILVVVIACGEVDVLDVPAVGGVPGGGVLTEGDRGVVFDGDLVVVPDHQQIRQLLRAGQRGGLTGHALFEVAVGGEHDDRVIEGRGAGSRLGVEQSAFAASGHGHAHGRSQTGAERARGDLDAGGVSDLRMARCQRTPGAQRLEVVELEPEPGQVELDVLGERTVTAGEDETITADPSRVGRVVSEAVLIQVMGDGRQAHGRSRVPVPCLLHRIRGEEAGSVDCAIVEFSPGQSCHVVERSFVRLRACIQTLPVGCRKRRPCSPPLQYRGCETFRLLTGRVWSRAQLWFDIQ